MDWSLLTATYHAWTRDHVPRLGAALAFYSMLSLGPLMLLCLSAATLLFGQEAAEGRVLGQIQQLIGYDGARAVQEILRSAAHEEKKSWVAAAIGLITLLAGASGVFGQLQEALNTIWHVEPKPGRGFWRIARERFFSVTVVFGTGFLLLISLVISAGLAAMGELGHSLLPAAESIMQAVNAGVSLLFTAFLFALMFKYLPDATVAWRDVGVGALLTAVLFTIGKLLIGLYLGHSALGSSYGAAGSMVVVLVWVYYSAQILFFGAAFTRVYASRHGKPIIPTASAQLR